MENKLLNLKDLSSRKMKYCMFKIDKFLQDRVSSQTRLLNNRCNYFWTITFQFSLNIVILPFGYNIKRQLAGDTHTHTHTTPK
jgi:hypothetical protein